MSTRTFIATVAALGAVALLAYGLIAKEPTKLTLGEPLPDDPLPALGTGLSGDRQIADYRGRYVLVNLWASWCEPCRTESPDLQAYYQAHRKQLTVLGINTEDNTGDALGFVEEFGLTYPMSIDNERRIRDQYGSVAFPESFLVDPRGRLVLIKRGTVDTEYLEAQVTPILQGRRQPLADPVDRDG